MYLALKYSHLLRSLNLHAFWVSAVNSRILFGMCMYLAFPFALTSCPFDAVHVLGLLTLIIE